MREYPDKNFYKLFIITINFDAVESLEKCIFLLQKILTTISFDLCVIDNNSPQRDIESLPQRFPNVKFHFLKENLGFARANNYAATLSNSDYLLFLNPDTLLIEDCISPIIDFIEHNPKAGACGPMLLNQDMTYQNSTGSKMGLLYEIAEAFLIMPVLRCIQKRKYLKLQMTKQPLNQAWISGAFMTLKRSVFVEAGGFDPDYFLNYEDIDLCKKIEDKSYNNYYFPYLKCMHLDHRSFIDNYELLVLSRYESRLIYANKNYSFIMRLAVRVIHIIGLIIRILFVSFIYSGNERRQRYIGYIKSLKLYSKIF